MTLNTPSNPPMQARAVATRRKLLDAAVASLCDSGYAGTTTTLVAQRAGVVDQPGSTRHVLRPARLGEPLGAARVDNEDEYEQNRPGDCFVKVVRVSREPPDALRPH